MRKRVTGICILLLVCSAPTAWTHTTGSTHAEYVTAYDGPRTCTAASCHENAAKDVAASLHYQQQAVPAFLDGWEAGKMAGMMVSY